MAAKSAPKLSLLTIRGNWDIPTMHSLLFLSQLKELILHDLALGEGVGTYNIMCLTGLRSLEVPSPDTHECIHTTVPCIEFVQKNIPAASVTGKSTAPFNYIVRIACGSHQYLIK
jgi:hypothetical protein